MSIKVKFIVMISEDEKRINNAKTMQEQIPDLVMYYGDNGDVFKKFINCFRLEEEYDGLVLLEDDIILCRDFYNRIMVEINRRPHDIISFFEKPLTKKALASGYMAPSEFLYNQCNYYPKDVCRLIPCEETIASFKKWYCSFAKWVYPSDNYINYVLVKNKRRYYMKVPFLVQHQPWDTTWGGRAKTRQTKYFIDDIGEGNEQDSD